MRIIELGEVDTCGSFEQSIKDYKYKDIYHRIPGPNSDTFVQTIIDDHGLPCVLPDNAIGKHYMERAFDIGVVGGDVCVAVWPVTLSAGCGGVHAEVLGIPVG